MANNTDKAIWSLTKKWFNSLSNDVDWSELTEVERVGARQAYLDEARILDHTKITFSKELALDWAGIPVAKEITIDGILFTLEGDAGYVNNDIRWSLYLECSDEEDGSEPECWYAQSDPFED